MEGKSLLSQQTATFSYPEPDQSSLPVPFHFLKIYHKVILPPTPMPHYSHFDDQKYLVRSTVHEATYHVVSFLHSRATSLLQARTSSSVTYCQTCEGCVPLSV